jgi:hypothetical protein
VSCKLCEKAGYQSPTTCAYCGMGLSSRHEHDHAPIPKRHGGEDIWPVCLNCHDLKDRIPTTDWDVETFTRAVVELNPASRILVAKLIAMTLDAQVRVDFDGEKIKARYGEIGQAWKAHQEATAEAQAEHLAGEITVEQSEAFLADIKPTRDHLDWLLNRCAGELDD